MIFLNFQKNSTSSPASVLWKLLTTGLTQSVNLHQSQTRLHWKVNCSSSAVHSNRWVPGKMPWSPPWQRNLSVCLCIVDFYTSLTEASWRVTRQGEASSLLSVRSCCVAHWARDCRWCWRTCVRALSARLCHRATSSGDPPLHLQMNKTSLEDPAGDSGDVKARSVNYNDWDECTGLIRVIFNHYYQNYNY